MFALMGQARRLRGLVLVALAALPSTGALHYSLDRSSSNASLTDVSSVVDADGLQGQYLVDNSLLKSSSGGLTYRLSKELRDVDKEHYELYGTIISGVNEGDDWLRVGGLYLPMKINGTPVMVLQGSSLSQERPRRDEEAAYVVDNSVLKSSKPGLTYRLSKDLDDKDDGNIAEFGSTVTGTDEGDGWLKVENRYLPKTLGGKRVLMLEDDGTRWRAWAEERLAKGASRVHWRLLAAVVTGCALVCVVSSLVVASPDMPQGKSVAKPSPTYADAAATPTKAPGQAGRRVLEVPLSPERPTSPSEGGAETISPGDTESSTIEDEYEVDFVRLTTSFKDSGGRQLPCGRQGMQQAGAATAPAAAAATPSLCSSLSPCSTQEDSLPKTPEVVRRAA
eukprot:TRINITY_DN23383_c0_g1_i1.p1 TRINITY_DN23383_c0_g1~~TRINITY_DN23383_c0_g1_i1.p1  ORF type:complete len:393 (-),score=94.44 TRINITY_DN23383_c0_g1_i1:132-1310(-)